MRKGFFLLMLVVIGCGGAGLTQAQNSSEEHPLIIQARSSGEGSQFYRYVGGAWEVLPTGEIYDGSVSSKSDYAAVLIMPPFLQPLVAQQSELFGTAWDIVLLNLRDGSRQDIATQSDAIRLRDEGGYEGGIKRTVPAWSPDGHAFVWTEQDYPAQSNARLLVYDLESNETRILDDTLPYVNLSSDGLPSTFSWDAGGIVVYTNDPSDNAETLRLYDAETGLRQVVHLPAAEFDDYWQPFLGPMWLMGTQDQPPSISVIAPSVSSGRMFEIDWNTGEVAYTTSRIELMSASNPVTSVRLLWSCYHDFMDPPEALLQIVAEDGTPMLTWDDFLGEDSPLSLNRFVLAPSGQAAAYMQNGALYMWQDGNVQEILLPPGLYITDIQWGPSIWRYATPNGPDEIG